MSKLATILIILFFNIIPFQSYCQNDIEKETIIDVQKTDILNFWKAYDKLPLCKNKKDSIEIIQKFYLDKATNGLKEFQKVRDFSPEFFVERIKKYDKYYKSIRENSLLIANSNIIDKSIIENFKKIYPVAKAKKICFAIGPMSTGGTISNDYLLIGTEIYLGDKSTDLSEVANEHIKNIAMGNETKNDIIKSLREVVTHEFVHTQQNEITEKSPCKLLRYILNEGIADFIAEKILEEPRKNKIKIDDIGISEYELWEELKSELCTENYTNWLWNNDIKDRPSDIGYFMGYQIAKAYYENSTNKQKAIVEIIQMDNPILFLEKSKYADKFK